MSISSHFIEYTLRNKNSSKLLLDSDALMVCLTFSFSLLWSAIVPIGNRESSRKEKVSTYSCKVTF